MRGYYSLIQYCPDSAKAEAANIGVLLLCPEVPYCAATFANANDRVRRFFGLSHEEIEQYSALKASFVKRLELDSPKIVNLGHLEQFIGTRANKIFLTAPRNMRVDVPEEDLKVIFKELVGGRAMGETIQRRGQGLSVRPRLRELFERHDLSPLIEEDVSVELPFGRAFTAPYAFTNGIDNFVVPQTMHVNRDQTLHEAELIAFRGGQLSRHGSRGRKAKIIVPIPDPEGQFYAMTRDVAALFADSGVRTVFASDLEEFGQEILSNAHAR